MIEPVDLAWNGGAACPSGSPSEEESLWDGNPNLRCLLGRLPRAGRMYCLLRSRACFSEELAATVLAALAERGEALKPEYGLSDSRTVLRSRIREGAAWMLRVIDLSCTALELQEEKLLPESRWLLEAGRNQRGLFGVLFRMEEGDRLLLSSPTAALMTQGELAGDFMRGYRQALNGMPPVFPSRPVVLSTLQPLREPVLPEPEPERTYLLLA
ncbi:hypothetical protein ACP26L_17145 [Paenibacillus sp. S-38]|uniref:hypothetical protein n=1 Tax=Paenibacillus sp. S-38 TaxID=3416710 RepID=UPI003CF8FBA3